MSKTLLICHVVFPTHQRYPSINPAHKRELYAVMYGILKKYNCWTYQINGMPDHIHLCFDLHPTVAMANLVKELKVSTNKWLTDNEDFPQFNGWGTGYFAVSVSPEVKDNVVNYIKNQVQHHVGRSCLDEMEDLVNHFQMRWHPDDWV